MTYQPSEATMAAARRIMHRCDELAGISAMKDDAGQVTGILRAYLTPEHAEHNALAAAWMTEVGLRTWQDAAGNQCGRLEGREEGLPALMLASHLDTVPDAGRYDGILGVLLAIEVARRVKEKTHGSGPGQDGTVQDGAGQSGTVQPGRELPFALEVAAYADEEGTRFGTTLLGSWAMAGKWQQEWWDQQDAEGITLREAFRSFGLDPERVGEATRRPEDLVGYLEAHIEQGPYLEAEGRALGVVTSIAGARRFRISVIGEARHAGGTPYERRKDALIGASQAVLDIERIAREQGAIATVGQLEVHPGAINVVPGRADFSLDLRAEQDAVRDRAWETILAALEQFCAARGLQVEVEEIHSAPTVYCDQRLREAIVAGVAATGDTDPMHMYSRAGHDAMAMAAVTDFAMLFTRCEDGISHHPAENVTVEDVAYALDAFEAAVWEVAERKAAEDHG